MSHAISLNDRQFQHFLDALGEQVRPAVAEEAARLLEEKGLTKALRRHEAALLPAPERIERSHRFFKAVLRGDRAALKALSGSDNAAGGYLVPAETRQEIVARLPEEAELFPHVRVVPVSTDSGLAPSLQTDISVTWRAASSSENTAFGESDPVLGSVAWNLKRADAITKISRELVGDSAPAVVDFITGLFREAIARERDRVIAVGDGSDEPYGLYSAAGIEAVTVDGSLAFASLVEIEQSVAKKHRARARWIMNSTNLQRVYSLVDTQNRPLFLREVVGGAPESRLLGYPVAQQEDLPDHTILFGDLSGYLWFDRGEMGIESTNEGGDAFEKHQTWIKVWERVDGRVGLAEAFVKGTGITA